MYTAQGTLDRDAILQQYAPLVRRLALQLSHRLPSNVELDDLIQTGTLGLLDAFSRFDPAQGVQFETFATRRVRGAMLDELRGTDWAPRVVRRNQREIETTVRRLEQRLGRPPNDAELAEGMNLTLSEYQQRLGECRGAQLVYLEDLNGADSDADGEGALERLVDACGGPDKVLEDERFRQSLAEAIARLPEREQLIFALYYDEELTLKEIGTVLGVTESRVSQLHTQAMARLRAGMREWVR